MFESLEVQARASSNGRRGTANFVLLPAATWLSRSVSSVFPNVGKVQPSSTSSALVGEKAEAANYPFCTIEPNVGVVIVPDDRLEKIDSVIHADKIVPTTFNFVDIAGLVRGASKGEGLGKSVQP